MNKFIIDLCIILTILDPIPLLCDNSSAIAQAKEPMSHKKSKHILRCFHLIRELVAKGDVSELIDAVGNCTPIRVKNKTKLTNFMI